MSTDYSHTWVQLLNNIDKIQDSLPDMHDDDIAELRDALDSLTDAIDHERDRR